MFYEFWFILLCILLAILFGILIGWILRHLTLTSRVEALENSSGGGGGKSYDSEIANHEKRIVALEKTPKVAAPVAAAAGFVDTLQEFDDLKEISGIGKVLEKRLNTLGVKTFRDVAAFKKADIDRISDQIGPFRNRIVSDNWVGQAKHLHKTKYGKDI